MLKLLKSRVLLVGLGLAMIALFIWYAGPLFAFGSLQPLLSEASRLVAIALVVAIWGASVLLKRLRANRASDQLVAAVVQQSNAEQPSADQVQLRERFEEAVAALKQKRKGGASLYDLPWYVIIGAPGSGKTTALVNSGLHFPLEQRTGKGALRGIGGTRNCDWWFTDEAVFLDTAGRYTTQDSDAAADREGWTEFLALLRKYRKRRPVNGVILTISAQDLMVQGQRDREAHVAAARRRLDELNRELHIQIPVYLMVTKCDLVSGFTEYFDDLAQAGRAQVWGVTFPYEQTAKGQAAPAFPVEFDALMTRLNERLFARVEEDHDVGRRARIFGFPQQMAALREALSQFVSEVFASTRFDQQILLRGVYFTSGTQEGTPIDRLLGSIGRRFAVAPQALAAPPGRGKAYFIERLLKEVLLAESGLAGVNRKLEVQKAALQLGAYAAMALIAVIGVTMLFVSYRRNQAYIAEVDAAVNEFRQRPRDAASSLESVLPRLDAVRAVADVATQYEDDTPLAMRWGLYQGRSLGNAARDAYARELDGALLSGVAARFRQRLIEHGSDADALFEYLKAYLMLGSPERLEKEQLAVLADYEWEEAFADNPDARESLSRHFRSLLDNEERLRAVPLDERLVAQARAALGQASIPRIIYSQLKLAYPSTAQGALRLDVLAGLGADQALKRKSGTSLAQPMPALYTKPVFAEITGTSADALVSRYTTDSWVWGEGNLSFTGAEKLKEEVIGLYEQDYIDAWEKVLADVEVVPFPNVAQATRVLAIVAGATSPLRGLLKTASEHTTLVSAPAAGQAAPASTTEAFKRRLDAILNKGKETIGISTVVPGARITEHFAPIHQLVAGEAGASPLDRVLAQINQIQQQLRSVGTGLGETSPLDALSKSGRGDMVKQLQQDAETLPPVVGNLVTQISGRAERIAVSEGGSLLEQRYRTEVVAECRTLIGGKYPFAAGAATDVQLADFAEVFGHGGLFDRFFEQNLEPLVDTSRPEWVWRTAGSGASVGVGLGMLRQVQLAERIREMFFTEGSRVPELAFTIVPLTLERNATKFVLEIDGQRADYQFGPERPWPMKWPGPKPGVAVATFETTSGNRNAVIEEGPWAFFKMLDATRPQPESGTRYVLAFETGGLQATVRLEASRARNPFGNQDLRQFRCG